MKRESGLEEVVDALVRHPAIEEVDFIAALQTPLVIVEAGRTVDARDQPCASGPGSISTIPFAPAPIFAVLREAPKTLV